MSTTKAATKRKTPAKKTTRKTTAKKAAAKKTAADKTLRTGKGVEKQKAFLNKLQKEPLPELPKNKGGRPSKYNPEWCDKIRELAKEGMTKAELMCELNISMGSWQRYEAKHEEFRVAVKDAEMNCLAWWERTTRHGINRGNGFNATIAIFRMKNMFPALYRDRQEHKIESETKLVVEQAKNETADILDMLRVNTAAKAEGPQKGVVH